MSMAAARLLREYKWPLLAFGASFAFQLWLCAPLIADYYPTKDDLAVEAISTPLGGPVRPADWFTQGFHGLFATIPEWETLKTDYWRPLANGWFWLQHLAFGTHFGAELALGYGMHALAVGLTVFIATRVLGLPSAYVALSALVALFNPALWSRYGTDQAIASPLQYPIYQTEILCALLMLGGYVAFVRERFLMFAVLLTAALCLKETALTVPVSAAGLLVLSAGGHWRESGRRLAWVLLPLGVWVAARVLLLAHGSDNEALSPGGRTSALLQPIRNALFWPTTTYVDSLLATRQALVSRDGTTLLLHGGELALNLLWWLAILLAVGSGWVAWRRRSATYPAADPWLTGLVFALGNLALVLLLQQSRPRYGYFWFDLGPAVLFVVLARYRGLAPALVMSAGVVAPQLAAAADLRSTGTLEDYRTIKRSARQLAELLGRMPADSTVYLIDDVFIKPSGPRYLEALAGFHGRLVVVNSVDPVPGCVRLGRARAVPVLRRDDGGVTLDYPGPPECFVTMWTDEPPLRQTDGHSIYRGKWLTYRFPALSLRVTSLLTGRTEYVYGDRWSLRAVDPACARPDGCHWLALDVASRRYRELVE